MSLQVWLPLTGHLNNQGLDSVSVTSTATVDSNGKIGQCYSFNGAKYIAIPKVILPQGTTEWTYSAWIYLNNTSGSGATCLFSCRKTANQTGYTIFIYPNTSQILVDDGTRYSVTPTTFSAQTWYHLAIVRKPSGKFIYINGELKASTTTVGTTTNLNTNGCLIGLAQSSTALTTGDQGWNGKLNDVRIYDHALSAKEVKELSKGLVLHYPLSQGSTNLYDFESIANKWTAVDVTLANYNDDSYRNVLKVTVGSSLTSEHRIYRNVSNIWKIDQVYTVSFLAKASKIVNCTMSRSIANFTNNFTLTTEWKRYVGKITSTATADTGTLSFQINTTSCDVYITQIKLEYGDIATPYTPGPGDSHYNAMGYNSTTEYDVSGYNYHGTKNGTLTYNSDSARYAVCSQFNGTNSYIEAESLPAETKTISIWVKTNWTQSSSYKLLIHDKQSGLAIGWLSLQLITYVGTSNGGSGSRIDITTTNYTANKWNHVVVVKTGNTTRDVYINGIKATPSGANYWGGDLNKLNIGARHMSGVYSAYFDGQISDFRAYATALSADDVKQLYNTAAALCNNGTLMAYSFNET